MTEVVDSAEDIEQAIDGLTDSVFGVSYSTLRRNETPVQYVEDNRR